MVKPTFLCAGMLRSGSTWLYNVVRLLCKEHYGTIWQSYITEYMPGWKGNAAVVKTHGIVGKLFEDNPTIVICRRDIRDVAASLILKKWYKPSNICGILRETIKTYEFYQPQATFDFEYGELLDNEVELAEKVGKALDLPCDAPKIVAEIERISYQAYYDRAISLFHLKHSTRRESGYYRDVLSPQMIKHIESAFCYWLSKWGYLA